MIFQQFLAQVIGNGTAAHDKGIAHRADRQMDTLEELVRLLLRGKEGDLVAVLQHKVAVGDDNVPAALHRADKDVALEPGGDLADRHAVQFLRCRQGKFDQPHAAARKGIDLAGARKAQQMGDFLGRRHFRVDDGRDTDLLFDKIQLMAVGRVAHAGNGVAMARLFGKHAAQQVQLVRAGHCNKNVCLFNARFRQRGNGGAVAHDAQHIVAFDQMFHTCLIGVHNRDVVAFLAELPRQRGADLAAAHQNDLHNKSFLLPCPFRRDGANTIQYIISFTKVPHFSGLSNKKTAK